MVEDISKEMHIFVRNNIHDKDFEDSYLIGYMELNQFSNQQSGYNLVDWFPGWSYDIESRRILVSPFPNRFRGAILYFEHGTNIHLPFVATLYEDQSSEDAERDIIGVYNCLSISLEDFSDPFFF